jgi:hypothetical protein
VIRVECKALQTNSVKQIAPGEWKGTFQCDASDRRTVTFPDGSNLETTCLLVGTFDLLAAGLFMFGKTWRFAFAKNFHLPRSKYKKYTESQQHNLLSASMPITWPLKAPYHAEPFALLDEIAAEKLAAGS